MLNFKVPNKPVLKFFMKAKKHHNSARWPEEIKWWFLRDVLDKIDPALK
jgi:hypothetical protein